MLGPLDASEHLPDCRGKSRCGSAVLPSSTVGGFHCAARCSPAPDTCMWDSRQYSARLNEIHVYLCKPSMGLLDSRHYGSERVLNQNQRPHVFILFSTVKNNVHLHLVKKYVLNLKCRNYIQPSSVT